MKKTGLNEYVYGFSADYDAIAVDDILSIHKYLVKRIIWYKQCVDLSKRYNFSCNKLKCVSMNYQRFKARPKMTNINSNGPSFYPDGVKISKCSGSCNNINDPYAQLWVPDVSKNMYLKVFNLNSRTNETRYIKWHETCK